jgi:hypothetical protein
MGVSGQRYFLNINKNIFSQRGIWLPSRFMRLSLWKPFSFVLYQPFALLNLRFLRRFHL